MFRHCKRAATCKWCTREHKESGERISKVSLEQKHLSASNPPFCLCSSTRELLSNTLIPCKQTSHFVTPHSIPQKKTRMTECWPDLDLADKILASHLFFRSWRLESNSPADRKHHWLLDWVVSWWQKENVFVPWNLWHFCWKLRHLFLGYVARI